MPTSPSKTTAAKEAAEDPGSTAPASGCLDLNGAPKNYSYGVDKDGEPTMTVEYEGVCPTCGKEH